MKGFWLAVGFVFVLQSRVLADDFSWIEETQDKSLWATVRNGLAAELAPDDLDKNVGYLPNLYRRIDRIGRYQDACFVVIAKKQTQSTDDLELTYEAYNYNLKSHKKEKMADLGLELKFYGSARFASNPIKDLLFSFVTCHECESMTLLIPFQFDAKMGKWRGRSWVKGRSHLIVLASENQFMDQGVARFDTLSDIRDLTNDGFDDVLDWSRWSLADNGVPLSNRTLLYTVQKGREKIINIVAPDDLNRLHRHLCADTKNPLCVPQ